MEVEELEKRIEMLEQKLDLLGKIFWNTVPLIIGAVFGVIILGIIILSGG